MARELVCTENAPIPVGPYSQAAISGGFVCTAGQLGLDPTTGKLVGPGVEEQTERALLNLKAILEAAGSSLDMVVKVTVFLADMSLFGAMNGVYQRFFGAAPPARTCVAVAALPMGALVEVEAIAVKVDGQEGSA
ncbi:MAG: RidA family protein [Bacillota bacterium]